MKTRLLMTFAVAACLVGAAPASAQSGSQGIYDEYLQTGLIAGCNHTAGDLQAALTTIPADVQAYDPGFSDALNGALDRRASGCDGAVKGTFNPSGLPGTTLAADGAPGPNAGNQVTLAPLPAGEDTTGSLVLIIFGIVIGAALLTALIALLPGWRAQRRRT